jgi:TolB-like protein/Flp pilus assembly protein TadD
MAGEIFISYRRSDEAWARLLYRQLKSEGVEAWYDGLVGPGQEWRTATAKALEASQIFVLLFSEHAAQSSDIVKELAAATHEKKLVVPVRLQNIEPKGAFLYELASRNWVNAYENTEARLAELAKGLAHLVRTGARDESVLPFERSPRKSMRKPALIAAAVIVLAATLAALFWIYPRSATLVASSQPPPGPSGISVAVLPFLNLSSDKDQEFFSDGMTEEITSALAKVPGLAVIGRTSAFQFKGENKDMRAIGEALGAKNLLEGSVRKAGDQVRITVQLIKAADGTHLWTENYDRKLTDIFAVQEDIATAIAGALQVPLGLKQRQNLVSNRTADTESYEAYLRAKELIRARGFINLTSAITLLEQATARDPNYAPAWALLASAHALLPGYASTVYSTFDVRRQAFDTDLPKAESAARKALALDANNSEAWMALGQLSSENKNFIQSEDAFKRALRLDPKNVPALHFYAHLLSGTGRLKEALELRRQTVVLDPLDPRLQANLAHVYALNGQYDAALGLKIRSLNIVAEVYAAQGRFTEAADTLLRIPPGFYPAGMVETAARALRAAPAQMTSPQNLPAFAGNALAFVYLYVGAAGRALDFYEAEVKAGHASADTDPLWFRAAAPLRKTERFKALMRNGGFVDFWRARGWPDLCHPVGAGDFACN